MAKITFFNSAEQAGEKPREISSILIQGSPISILLMVEMVSDGPGEDPGDL